MMEERQLILHNLGFWRDEVGTHFEKSAAKSVDNFNEATKAIWERIDKLDSYKIDDIHYERQSGRLLEMKVNFNG